MIEIKQTEAGEVYELAPRLRIEDKEELKAAGYEPIEGLLESFHNSFLVRSIYEDDKIIGMFGVCHFNPDWDRIWFLGSSECEDYPITFLKKARAIIKVLNHRNLFNGIYKHNKTHIEFVKRLGFTVEKKAQKGFYTFYKLRECKF